MVCDRDRLVSPGGCRLHQIARLRHGIHRTHLGMAVKLDPLPRPGIAALLPEVGNLHDAIDISDGQIRIELVDRRDTSDLDEHPCFQLIRQLRCSLGVEEHLDSHRIGEISQCDDQDGQIAPAFCMDVPGFNLRNLSADRHIPHLPENRLHLDRQILKVPPIQHIRVAASDK